MKERIGLIMFLVVAVALLAAVACGGNGNSPVTDTPIKGAPPAMVEVPAPVEGATVVTPQEVGGDYVLKITSGLPSGCANFSRYQVERDGNGFAVEVSNLVPAPDELIACTEIYGYHEGEVVLGSGLTTGETYTVAINDEFTLSFTAQNSDGLAMVEKESPIEEIDVTEADGGYTLTVVSRLPMGSSCSKFSGYQINRRFAEQIEVTVTHREVAAGYVGICTSDLPAVFTEIPLGSNFADGQTYTVVVNGTEAIFPQEELATVEVPAPIEDAKVIAPDNPGGEYTLEITSGLPSGCAQFNGYNVSRTGNEYFVTVTNLMPDPGEPIACTAIYGYHEDHFSLEGDLTPGDTYTVTINGALTNSFTVLNAEGMVEKESPIEKVDVAEVDGGYIATVVSRLPKGSSCSKFSGISKSISEHIIQVSLGRITIATLWTRLQPLSRIIVNFSISEKLMTLFSPFFNSSNRFKS